MFPPSDTQIYGDVNVVQNICVKQLSERSNLLLFFSTSIQQRSL